MKEIEEEKHDFFYCLLRSNVTIPRKSQIKSRITLLIKGNATRLVITTENPLTLFFCLFVCPLITQRELYKLEQ